MLVKAV